MSGLAADLLSASGGRENRLTTIKIIIMDIGGLNFTNFQNVRITGSRLGSSTNTAVIRFTNASANEGTLTVGELETGRYWNLPNKSGTFPVSGTMAVQLPAVAATTFVYNTAVTVGGIRAEDGITATVNQQLVTTARILVGARPTNGTVTLSFVNLGVATAYGELVVGYTAVR